MRGDRATAIRTRFGEDRPVQRVQDRHRSCWDRGFWGVEGWAAGSRGPACWLSPASGPGAGVWGSRVRSRPNSAMTPDSAMSGSCIACTSSRPRSLHDRCEDFNNVGGDASAPLGYGSIRNGQVVVRWEATLPDTEVEPKSPPSDEVLAYLKDVPQQGGAVLMLDRRVRHMTAEEFKSAKLAGTEGAAAKKPRTLASNAFQSAGGIRRTGAIGSRQTTRWVDRKECCRSRKRSCRSRPWG